MTQPDFSRLRVLVLFGGRSSEHSISCLSAGGVAAVIDRTRYDVVTVGITTDGRWLLLDGVPEREEETLPVVPETGPLVTLVCEGDVTRLVELDGDVMVDQGTIDVCFPVLHGPYGEDGAIQGYLSTMGVPYVGPDIAGSVLGIDKHLMKQLLASTTIPLLPYIHVASHEFVNDADGTLDRVESALTYPIFTKPSRQGSSIGITKATNRTELAAGLSEAFRYDHSVLAEQGVEHPREIECGVIGNDDIVVAGPGETQHDGAAMYDFDAKYVTPVTLTCPADVPPNVVTLCQRYARDAYQALGERGMTRVDFFYDEVNNHVYLNEVNTIPGLTSASMFPPLWDAEGINFTQLIDRLIDLACQAGSDPLAKP